MALSTNYILNIQQVIIPKDVNGTGIINPDDIPPPKPKELVILPFYDECNPPPNCSLFFNGEGDIKFLIASVGDLAGKSDYLLLFIYSYQTISFVIFTNEK